MNTACSHCGKHFQVSERALGKRAKCKGCGQVFVVRPEAVDEVHLEEIDTPPPMGSTSGMRAVTPAPSQPASDDPLAALADAADSTSHDHADEIQEHARAHGSYLTRREHGEHGEPAPGAVLSMVMGIVGLVLMPVLIGAVCSVLAVVYGNGARKRIRRSRGVLEGRGQATAGIIMGWAGLALLGIGAAIVLILLIRNGPSVQTKEIVK